MNTAYKRQKYENDHTYRENIKKYKKEYHEKRRKNESEKEILDRRETYKKYRNDNKNKLDQYHENWRKNNREAINKKASIRKRERCLVDDDYRLKCNLRTRIWFALFRSGSKKISKTEELLGCNIDFLKQYIENLWEINMSWKTYGKNGWHIDHIIPCSAFDLTKGEEQKKCFHYTNLQPLWATTKIAIINGSKSIGNINKNNHFRES